MFDFLDYLRESVVSRVDGSDEEAARRSSVPTWTSLLGLIKHLTTMESLWFQISFAGRDDTVPRDDVQTSDTVATAVAAYRNAIRTSNENVDRCNDPDRLCAWAPPTAEPLSLRWLLVHMVEETARHAGHADIFRADRWSNWSMSLRSESDASSGNEMPTDPALTRWRVRREDTRVSPYLRMAATCQAKAPAGSQVRSMTVDSMDSMLHPEENATRISSCVTRRGPQSPGWRSLKQSM